MRGSEAYLKEVVGLRRSSGVKYWVSEVTWKFRSLLGKFLGVTKGF